jgi:hypothetical protein
MITKHLLDILDIARAKIKTEIDYLFAVEKDKRTKQQWRELAVLDSTLTLLEQATAQLVHEQALQLEGRQS